MVVPTHPELPGGGGYVLGGLRTLKPEAFGRPADNFHALSDKFGKKTEHWNGVDVTANARSVIGVDLYHALNTDAVLGYNRAFGAAWLRPTSILLARFAKISAQIDF